MSFSRRHGLQRDRSDEFAEVAAQLVAHSAKHGESLFLRSGRERRVFEGAMQPLTGRDEDGALLTRAITDGKHQIERLTIELGNMLGPLSGYVDA